MPLGTRAATLGLTRRHGAWLLVVAVLVTALTSLLADRATGDLERCRLFAEAAQDRAGVDLGSGAPVVVVGDSYSVGLGLEDPRAAWPSRLAGRVHVDGFSGSGFSARASECGRVSFADRAGRAVAAGGREPLVVVEGGLNDVDQSDAAIQQGFERLLRELDGQRVVVVGPVTAPARAPGVPRVDALLGKLAAAHDVPYVATSDLDLGFLGDRLHLTPAGHDALGDAVAERIAALDLP